MKTKKELTELNDETLDQVVGGQYVEDNGKTHMECSACPYTIDWMGDFVGVKEICPKCGGFFTLKGIEYIPAKN